MQIETNRLILRPWSENDAESLYEYAKDPRVGYPAGWPAHQSIEESRTIIREIFSQDGVFALVLKPTNEVIGCVGVLCGSDSNMDIPYSEGEISYWIGVPFWGNGLMTEAVTALIEHSFKTLGLKALWCSYFDGNIKSQRVQEKCGFKYHHKCDAKYFPLINESRIEHVSHLAINSQK